MNTNLSTLAITSDNIKQFKLRIYLHSGDGTSTPTYYWAQIEYRYFIQEVKDELEGYCEIEKGLVTDKWINDKKKRFVIPFIEDKIGLSLDGEEIIIEYYDGNDENYLILSRKPVSELISVEYVYSADYITSIGLSQFVLIAEEGIIKSVRRERVLGQNLPVFPKGNRNIKVTYKVGYDITGIPEKLHEAVKYLTCEKILSILEGRTGGGDISVQGYSRSYGERGKFTHVRNELARMGISLLDDYLTGVTS
jgi:hypothetical protein